MPANLDTLQQTALAIQQALANIGTQLSKVFPQSIGTSTTATAGSATLPANPVGFLDVVNPATGVTVRVPFYHSP